MDSPQFGDDASLASSGPFEQPNLTSTSSSSTPNNAPVAALLGSTLEVANQDLFQSNAPNIAVQTNSSQGGRNNNAKVAKKSNAGGQQQSAEEQAHTSFSSGPSGAKSIKSPLHSPINQVLNTSANKASIAEVRDIRNGV